LNENNDFYLILGIKNRMPKNEHPVFLNPKIPHIFLNEVFCSYKPLTRVHLTPRELTQLVSTQNTVGHSEKLQVQGFLQHYKSGVHYLYMSIP